MNTSPISVMDDKLCVCGGKGAKDTTWVEINAARVSGAVSWGICTPAAHLGVHFSKGGLLIGVPVREYLMAEVCLKERNGNTNRHRGTKCRCAQSNFLEFSLAWVCIVQRLRCSSEGIIVIDDLYVLLCVWLPGRPNWNKNERLGRLDCQSQVSS